MGFNQTAYAMIWVGLLFLPTLLAPLNWSAPFSGIDPIPALFSSATNGSPSIETNWFVNKIKKKIVEPTQNIARKKLVVDKNASKKSVIQPAEKGVQPIFQVIPGFENIQKTSILPTGTNSVQPVSDGFQTTATDDTCSGANPNLQQYIYASNIEISGDVDWFSGNFNQNGPVRFILIPAHGKDYDLEVFDSCGGASLARCQNSGDNTESCEVTVNGDFYVRVYAYNTLNFSSSAPYRIAASLPGSCNITALDGSASKSSFNCTEPIQGNNMRFTNNSGYTFDYFYYEELYDPSWNLVQHVDHISQAYQLTNGSTLTVNSSYSPSGSWRSGGYDMRSYVIGYCERSGAISTWPITSKTSNVTNATVYCSSCTSHSYQSCVGTENLYWFNSCSQQEDLAENCNNRNYYGSFEQYCKNSNDLWQHRIYNDYGCSGSSCSIQTNNYTDDQFLQTCSNGCANNQCQNQTCTPHNSYQCVSNDVYWFNSCGTQEGLKESCNYGCSGNACNPPPLPDLTIESSGITFEKG